MNYRMLVCLLLISPMVISAMQIHPEGTQQEKSWCSRIYACLRACCCKKKVQAERDAQERAAWLAETDQIMQGAMQKGEQKKREQKTRALLTAKSQDLREAYGHTPEGRRKRDTGDMSDPDYIIQFKEQQKQVRAATPRPLLSLTIDPQAPTKLSARASTQLNTPQTPQLLPMSPTPAPHLMQATPVLQVEDV